MLNFLSFFVIAPFIGSVLVALTGKFNEKFAKAIFVAVSLFLASLSLSCILVTKDFGIIVHKTSAILSPLYRIPLILDGFSTFMLVVSNVITFFIALFSPQYMAKYTQRWKFYALFLLLVTGMNGVILSGDILNLLICLEAASIASYALVAFGTEKEELEATIKYLIMSTVGAFFIILGIILLYCITHTLNMALMSSMLKCQENGPLTILAAIFFIAGFGIKAALVPFHSWLPDAHQSAPAPVSAVFSGILIKILGIYAIVRIMFNVLGITSFISTILTSLGIFSILFGILYAAGQRDIKRMFAYSSISHIGYIALGFGIGTKLAILGSLLHIFNHSAMKSLLFLNSGSIEYSTGTRDMDKLGGLRTKLPITGITSLIASLSISGIPPFGGFFSKLLIIVGAVMSGNMLVAFIAVLGSMITLAVFANFQRNVFFSSIKEEFQNIKEAPMSMKASMLALSILCIFGGLLLLPQFSGCFLGQAGDALLNCSKYANAILGKM